jgi:glycosyltransferase 2 family protein
LLRILGLILFGYLLYRLDASNVVAALTRASAPLLLAAVVLNIPQIGLKIVRWRVLLQSQGIRYRFIPASLSYFGSIFLGLLTPGRLGELAKAMHVFEDCSVPIGRALSSSLLDRCFDLLALMSVGTAAYFQMNLPARQSRIASAAGILALVVGAALILMVLRWTKSAAPEPSSASAAARPGWSARKALIGQLLDCLRTLTFSQLGWCVALTASAYLLFFLQCFLVERALGVGISFAQTSYAVSLGSLVTLLPISISGLGTREATIVMYLGTLGIKPETAMSFSLLIFSVFYVAGGIMGAVAWWIKPMPVRKLTFPQ